MTIFSEIFELFSDGAGSESRPEDKADFNVNKIVAMGYSVGANI